MIGLLVIALVCNELLKPVTAKWHEPSAATEPAREREEASR